MRWHAWKRPFPEDPNLVPISIAQPVLLDELRQPAGLYPRLDFVGWCLWPCLCESSV
jgi:hypothetical protein